MNSIECSTSSLKLKENTRLQCLHGCLHYNRNPMCPPSCPEIHEFKQLIETYQKVKVFFETAEFTDKFDLAAKRNSFQTKLLEIEHRLRREGKFYALCFVSGACAMCEAKNCSLSKCKRVMIGRVSVCATGIDLMHLSAGILGLSKKDSLSFWKPNFSKNHFDGSNNKYLCLGLIFY